MENKAKPTKNGPGAPRGKLPLWSRCDGRRPELTQAPWGEGKDGAGLEWEMSEQSTSGNELLLARGGARERGSVDLPAGR